MKRTRNKYRDLTNETFGRLKVLYRAENIKKHVVYQCECTCGAFKTIRGGSLRSGLTRSCGCFQRECAAMRGPENTTHGCARRSEKSKKTYQAWRDARYHYDGVH